MGTHGISGREVVVHGKIFRVGSPLSPREEEVLALLRQGYSNLNIAHLLTLTENTVKTHVSRVLAKTGASTRLEVVTDRQRGQQIEFRKKGLRIRQVQLAHQAAAIKQELAILEEASHEGKKPVVYDHAARAGIAIILADLAQGCPD